MRTDAIYFSKMLAGKQKSLEEENLSFLCIHAKLHPQTQHCAKVSCVNCCPDLQAIGGVNSEASDWLRWLPAHPHQLDDQLHLVARRLLQRGTPYSATNTGE